MCWARRIAALAVAGAFLTVPAAARADGDPASDILIPQYIFVPYDANIPAPQEAHLDALVRDAKTRGFPIKVALIASRQDLGAVTPLWRQPQRYARFLGQELVFWWKYRLLVVMPNGYGIYDHGKPVTAERRLLDRLAQPSGTGAPFAAAATTAVRKLAGQAGIHLALPAARAPKSHTTRDRIEIAAIVLVVTAFAALALVPRRRARRKSSGTRIPQRPR